MTSTTFFGTGHKAMLQWIGRLQLAIQERIDAAAEDDADSMVALVAAKKIASVIGNLMREARKSGLESDELRELATSQNHRAEPRDPELDDSVSCIGHGGRS